MKTNENQVRIYNFESAKVTPIPADELAPGMVEARIQGLEGTYWINPVSVKQGAFQHPPFDQERRAKIRRIMRALKEVRPLTFKQWEDGFRRDFHADIEISHWLHMSEIHTAMCRKHKLPLPQRKALFRVLMTCMCSGEKHIWQVLDPEGLAEDITREAVEEFYGQPTLKAAFEKLNPEDFADECGRVPVPVTALQQEPAREALQSADLVFGIDCHTRNKAIFFGLDLLKKIAKGNKAERVATITFLYDARTNQLEYLCAAVEVLKGSCCYGER